MVYTVKIYIENQRMLLFFKETAGLILSNLLLKVLYVQFTTIPITP